MAIMIGDKDLAMKISNIKAGLVLSYVALIVNVLINIAYTPIMLRLLGTSEYGLYNLSVSIVEYLNILSFGFVNAYLRFYYIYKVENDEEKIADLNGMYLMVFFIIGVISFIAGLVIVLNVGNIFQGSLTAEEIATARVLVLILIINVSCAFPLSIFGFYLTANEKFIFLRLLSLAQAVLLPIFRVIALLLGYKSIGLAIVALVLTTALNIPQIYYCYARCGYKLSFKAANLSMFKEIFIFSSYVFLNVITEQVNGNANKFLLGKFRGTTDVAVYGIAAQIHSIYLSISSNITAVVKPRVNNLVLSNNKKGMDSLFIQIGRLQFIILFLIMSGFVFLGKPFIYFWAGRDFENSFIIALILIVAWTLVQIQNLSTEIQRAKDLHKFRSMTLFLISIYSVIINVFLCQRYGGIGCAAGTAITVLIGNVIIMGIYNQTKVGLNIIGLYKSIAPLIPAMIPAIIAGIIINRFVDLESIQNFLLSGIVYTCLYLRFMWSLGFNEYEKNLLMRPMRMLFKRRV